LAILFVINTGVKNSVNIVVFLRLLDLVMFNWCFSSFKKEGMSEVRICSDCQVAGGQQNLFDLRDMVNGYKGRASVISNPAGNKLYHVPRHCAAHSPQLVIIFPPILGHHSSLIFPTVISSSILVKSKERK